jgi:hypothetical protein
VEEMRELIERIRNRRRKVVVAKDKLPEILQSLDIRDGAAQKIA